MDKVTELRLILTVDNLNEMIRFYRDAAGLPTVKQWNDEGGSGIILDAGRATLELIDASCAAFIDAQEVGRTVSGPVRLALKVGDVTCSAAHLVEKGAVAVAPPVEAPWSKVARVAAPDGMQLTLFEFSPLEG